MILDPFGEVLAESEALEDDVVVGLLTAEKIEQSSGRRYLAPDGPNSTPGSSNRRPPASGRSPAGWEWRTRQSNRE